MTIFLKFIIILLLLLLYYYYYYYYYYYIIIIIIIIIIFKEQNTSERSMLGHYYYFQGSIALPGFPSEETSQKSRWGLVKKKNMQLFLRQSRSLFVVSPLFHIPPRPRAYKRLKRY